jgi:hypothetical protein
MVACRSAPTTPAEARNTVPSLQSFRCRILSFFGMASCHPRVRLRWSTPRHRPGSSVGTGEPPLRQVVEPQIEEDVWPGRDPATVEEYAPKGNIAALVGCVLGSPRDDPTHLLYWQIGAMLGC